MRSPWDLAPGYEYDLLRLLPLEVAREVWHRSLYKGFSKMLRTRWFWVLIFVLSPVYLICQLGCWAVVGMLGLGWFGWLLAEMVFHLTLATILRSVFSRVVPHILGPLVLEELAILAEQERSKHSGIEPLGNP
ncbi:MAG: hypothetical protein C0467_24535 [Planctomycetaceae bacterium]|nr:hypothetical protein [Planctomycetaceae bacterium]